MDPTASAPARNPWKKLLALYLLAAVVRFVLALMFSQNPWIMPDESLYANLARSIWTEGGVLLRGQPLKYESLLYPLLISPLYGLPPGVDVYRAIELFNALSMTAVLFPAWYLARRVSGSESTAWLSAGLVLLLPDFALTQQVMAENIIFPLLSLAFLLSHRALKGDGKLWETPLLGAVCGLLYFTKPGFIVLGVLLSLALGGICLFRERGMFRRRQAASMAAGFVLTVLLAWLLARHAFGVDGAMTSVYQRQTPAFGAEVLALSLQGALLHAFYFLAALLFLPLALPLAYAPDLEAADKRLLYLAWAGAAATILGAAYIVFPGEAPANPLTGRVHLRYLAPFLPALLPFAFTDRPPGKRAGARLFALAAVFAACAVFLPQGAFLSSRSYPVDALLLSPIAENWLRLQTKPLFLIALAAGLSIALRQLHQNGYTPGLRRILAAFLCAWFALGNITGYDLTRHNTGRDWARDARQAAAEMAGEPFVFIAEDGGYFWNAATSLDVRLRKAAPFAELDDLVSNTLPDGAYQPFLPGTYWTETPARPTGQARALLMGSEVLGRVALSAEASVKATDNARYSLVSVPEGRPWVHSALSGFRDIGWVSENSRLTIFDPALNARETLTVSVNLHALENGSDLVISSGSQEKTVQIINQPMWVNIELLVETHPVVVRFSSPQEIYIHTYLVQ